MNPTKEFEIQNHDDLVIGFVEQYYIEFEDYAKHLGYYFYSGIWSEEHDEFFGAEVYNPSGHVVDKAEFFGLQEEFAIQHPEYWAFVEEVMRDFID